MPDLLLAPRLFRASKDDYVRPLHRRASLAIACACLVLGYIWLFVAWTAALRAHPMPGIADVAAPTALLLAAGLSLSALLANRDVTSDVILCGGVILVQYLWPHPLHYLLAPVIACLAGLLLSRSAAFLAALSLSFLPGLPTESLLALWIGATSFWVASDWIYAALRQVAERQEAALRLEKELLRRRQELRSLNDSLRNAYTLLERTNHELAEARDEAEEARRLKTQFAATISHELRTPLNLILGFSEVMYKTPESYVGAVLTPDLCGDIREIYRATAHLLDLVDDVLDLSRVEQVRLALVPEKTDMLALIHEAAQTVAGLFRGKVQLQLELPPSLPPCTVDRTRIRQVLINLLTNAARFTEQGEVRVSASFDEAHGEITICVSDTGPGIPAEERARLFDAFYQVASPLRRSQGGTGLGLAICKTFVQLHGGRIWVASEVGKGSHFYFSIPVRGQVQRAAAEWKLPGAPDPFGDSIVTLDQEGKAARWLERALSAFKVHNITNAQDASEVVASWHPRAVVAFQRDGDHASLRQLREALPWPGLPLVLCHLHNSQPLLQYKNVKAVLTKPITANALLEAVGTLGPVQSLLLADDDEGMTRLVQRALSLSRPQVRLLTAHNGRQALERLRREHPDALVLDLAMPEMDGLAVLEAMADNGLGDVPVLVLTAMDLHGPGGELAAQEMVVSSCAGLGGGEVARYLEALAQAAQPRYR